MQARLRLVQNHQRGRPRRQQRRNPKQVAQRPIRKFGCAHGTQQAVLFHQEFEPPRTAFNGKAAARESICDRCGETFAIADFDYGLYRGGKIASVIG